MSWIAVSIAILVLPVQLSLGTDPSFAIQNIQMTGDGGFVLTWATPPGKSNQVMYTDSLSDPWQELPGAQLLAVTNVSSLSYTDYPAADTMQRFYRIKTSRAKLIMSLVLDRSGSMFSDGGAFVLPIAVANFIDLFDNNYDEVSMNSFSSGASTDVTMRQPFVTAIKNAVSTLDFKGWTCTERGLTNGLSQNNSVLVPPGQNVVKVILLFTDGLANTWYWPGFNCGPQDIAPDKTLYDPVTGNPAPNSCKVPATIAGLSGTVTTSDQCGDMYAEAQARAEAVARLARIQGNIIYSIGFGDSVNDPKECGHPPLNPDFLKNLANTPDSATYDPSQPSGDYVIATTPNDLNRVFQEIAQQVLSQ